MLNPSTSTSRGVPKAALIVGGIAAAAATGFVVYYAYKSRSTHKGREFYVQFAEQKKKQGVELFRQKKYEAAISLFKEAIEALRSCSDSNEKNSGKVDDKVVKNLIANCNNNLSACCENLEDIDSSLQYCTEAISIDPNYVKSLKRRARIYEKSGKFVEALHDFFTLTPLCTSEQEIIALNTDLERVIKVANRAELEKLLKEADNKYKRIPQYLIAVWLWNTVTTDPILRQCEQMKEHKDISTTEGESSKHGIVGLNEALVLLNAGKYDDVLPLALKAVKHCDDQLKNVDMDEALLDDEEIPKVYPNLFTRSALFQKALANLLVARLYYLHNETQKAKEQARYLDAFLTSLDEEMKAAPQFVDMRVAYFTLMIAMADTDDEAQRLVEAATRIAPNNMDPLIVQGMRFLDVGQHEASLRIFERVLEVEPEHPYAVYYVLYLNYVTALKTQAVDQVRKHMYTFDVKLRDAKNPPVFAHLLFAKVCMHSDTIDLALASTKNALKIMPNNAYALFLSGIMDSDPMLTPQDPERVRAYVSKVEKIMFKVLEIDPNYWEPYRTLAKISLDKMKFGDALFYFEKAIAVARTRDDYEVILREKLLTTLTEQRMKDGRSMPYVFPDAVAQPQ